MATINFRIYGNDTGFTPIVNDCVVGKKMTASWMAKHYGKNWREEYEVMYLCHKNKYGIKWIIRTPKYDDQCGGQLPYYSSFHFSIV